MMGTRKSKRHGLWSGENQQMLGLKVEEEEDEENWTMEVSKTEGLAEVDC